MTTPTPPTPPNTGRRYCPACGSDQIAPRLVHHWRCEACGVTDWRNPLPVAGTFILRASDPSASPASVSDPLPLDGGGLGWGTAPLAQDTPSRPNDLQILLIRRAAHMDRGAGGWVFPGGFVERGETPWQGAIRETQEEALVTPRILRALPPRTVLDPHHVVMPFLAELDPSEKPRPGPEASEVRWFPLDEIPWDEVPFSTTVAALRGITEAARPTAHGVETFREVTTPGRIRAPLRFCIRCRAALGGPGEDGAVRCPNCG